MIKNLRYLCTFLLLWVAGVGLAQDVVEISTVDQLVVFRNQVNGGNNYAGKTVELKANLDMSSVGNWVPIGIGGGTEKSFCGTFNGNNHTISNLKSNHKDFAGLFGSLYGYVKNLKMENVNITSTHYAGGIAAHLGSENGKEISGCSVSGGTIKSTPELVNGSYDNGDKVGGILGYMAGIDKVTNCTATNLTIQGYRDLGGIVGIANGKSTVSGCTATGITIIQDNLNGYKSYDEVKDMVGGIAGRVAKDATITTDNSSSNVTIEHTNFLQISSVDDIIAFRDEVNAGKNYVGITVELTADLDMTSVENWIPIGNGGGTASSFCGTFDGKNHTISNLTSNNKDQAGLFGTLYGYVKNLKMENVNVTSTHYAGGIAAHLGSENGKVISNCHVSGGTITSTPELVNGSYDNGDKAGGILGYVTGIDKVTNCTATNLTIQGYRDLGGIVGIANGNSTVSGCTATGITIIQDNENGYKSYSDVKDLAQAIAGRVESGATVTDNNSSDITIKHINFGVAKIGEVEYETLQSAIDAAETGATINILKDFTLTTVTTSPSDKYNVNVNKSVTINGNNHVITASEGKRGIVLEGEGLDVTIKDLTIKSNKAEACLWIASNLTCTLDNTVLDGTNGKSYNQPLTIGSIDAEGRVKLNVTNGSVIKTNDAGTAHYSIIAWHPSDITVTGSKLVGWANVYLKPAAAGSTVKIDGSEMKSQGLSGPSNNFAIIVTEGGNNTIEVKDTKIEGAAVEGTYQSLFRLGGKDNVLKFLGNTTYETNDMTWGCATYEPGSAEVNKIYFDETTKAAFVKYFTEEGGARISETTDETGLYPLNYVSEVYYYWVVDGVEDGGNYDLAQPFVNGWLDNGEFIRLKKDVTLASNLTWAKENASFTMTFGDFKVTKGEYSIALKQGVTVKTDKQTNIFSAVDADNKVVETAVEGGYTYTVVAKDYVAQLGDVKYETLAEAVAAAEEGATIGILKDFTLTTVTTSPSDKYNVNVNKSVTINGNNHVITASEGKRGIVLEGEGLDVTIKDLTIKSNKAEACLWIASNLTCTLDNTVLDGTNGKSYNQPLTIGSIDAEGRVKLNVTNGSVIKTNDAGTAHYSIIAWHPSDITVTGSKLVGWANVYLKPAAAGSTVKIDGSEMKSQGLSGPSNNFAIIVTEGGNNTIEVKDTKIEGAAVEGTYQSLFRLGGKDNVLKFLGNTTYETNDMTWGCATYEPGSAEVNKIYFDETTKAAFVKYFTEEGGARISETTDETGLYPLNYVSEVYYYWVVDGVEDGGNYDLAQPFVNGWLDNGEFIRLKKDVTLASNLTWAKENASFTMTFGDFKVTKGEYSIALKQGVTVKTDKQTNIFSAVDADNKVVETAVEGGYTYTVAAKDYVAQIGDVKYESLQEAFNAANNDDVVKVLAEVTLSQAAVVPADKTVTLDLNGQTITATSSTIGNMGNLTVVDNAGNGKIVSTGNVAIFVGDNSTTTINSGIIESVEGAVITGRVKGATININGGTLSASDNAVVAGNGSAGYGGNTINIAGGTYNGGITSTGYVACGIYAPNNDVWNITGGTFNITGGAGVVQRAGTVNISDGVVFNVTGTATGMVGDSRVVVPCAAIVFDSQAAYPSMTDASSMNVSGGTFNAESAAVDYVAAEGAASHIAISGGKFSRKVPEECCAPNYVPTTEPEGGYYTVQTKEEAGIYELDDVNDQNAYPYPEGATATKVTYTRTFSSDNKDKYQSWMVPFDYTITSDDVSDEIGLKFYKINFIAPSKTTVVQDKTKVYIFIEPLKAGDVMRANKPYVVKPTKVLNNYPFTTEAEEGKTFTLHAEKSDKLIPGLTTTAFVYYFFGTFEKKYFHDPDQVLFMYGGNIVFNDPDNNLRTYRWYIKPEAQEGSDYAKPSIGFMEDDGETDGISNAQTMDGEIEGIYTLGGMKVEHPVKGVNIIKYTDGRTKKINVK